MSTFQSSMGNTFQTAGSSMVAGKANNPEVQAAHQGAEQAIEFQLWVAKQAATLSKLKVFSNMAKNVNDQQ